MKYGCMFNSPANLDPSGLAMLPAKYTKNYRNKLGFLVEHTNTSTTDMGTNTRK